MQSTWHLFLFFSHTFKATAYTGQYQVTFNWPNATNFYYMVQISPWLPLPKSVFSVGFWLLCINNLAEEETREVCQKRLGRKSGSLGNFYNVSAHIFMFICYSPAGRCMTFADCRLQTADCRPQTADCRPQTADRRLQTTDCRL